MSKYIEDVNHKINAFNLLDIYRTIKQMTAEYMFFLSIHVVLTKIYQMLGDKNKYQQIS